MSSHNARDTDRRKAFLLSQLQHSSDWIGSLAHKVIATEFIPTTQKGFHLNALELTKKIVHLSEKQYDFSEKKYYETTKKKDAKDEYCALYAHEYGLDIDKETVISKVQEFAAQIAENLFLQDDILNLLPTASWLKPEVNLAWKMNEQATAFGQLDVLAFLDTGKPLIIDWKTGTLGSGSKSQMRIYGKLVLSRWDKLTPDDLIIKEVNLRHGKVIDHKLNNGDLQLAENFIYRSVSDILQVTQDHKYNTQIQRISEYSFAGSENSCVYCKFKMLCEAHL